MSKKVAVVILNFNTREFLEKFLPSVCKTSYPNTEIIIADNASSDDSVQFVKDNYPLVKIILLEKKCKYNNSIEGFVEACKPLYVKKKMKYLIIIMKSLNQNGQKY